MTKEHMTIRLPSELKARVRKWAEEHEVSYTKAMELLLEQGLKGLGFIPDLALLDRAERAAVEFNLVELERHAAAAKLRRRMRAEIVAAGLDPPGEPERL